MVVLPATGAKAQTLFGTNLIRNGAAEEGAASTGSGAPGGIVLIPQWVTSGPFTVNQYGQTSATHLVPLSAPSSPARSTNFFAGGPTNVDTFAIQEVDLSPVATEIDSGGVQFCMAGYFGGFHHQNDNAVLSATFLASQNVVLSSNWVGHVLSAERSDDTATGSLLLRKTRGGIPAGTRKVRFRIYMQIDTTIPNQSYNDGYADNLSFVLTTPRSGAKGLSIQRSGADLVVKWPAGLTGFELQTTSQLEAPIAWEVVTNSMGVEAGWFVFTNNPDKPREFFRLIY